MFSFEGNRFSVEWVQEDLHIRGGLLDGLNSEISFLSSRWKNMWSLGAERGELIRWGGRRRGRKRLSPAVRLRLVSKRIWDSPEATLGPLPELQNILALLSAGAFSWCLYGTERCVGLRADGHEMEPSTPPGHSHLPGNRGRLWAGTVLVLNSGKESSFLPTLGLLSAQTLVVLHGLCAFFSLYAIFFSFSSRNLSSWENTPEGSFRRRMIPCVLSLHQNFWREKFQLEGFF